MPTNEQYQEYLNIIGAPDKMQKLAKLEILNDHGNVAIVIDNN